MGFGLRGACRLYKDLEGDLGIVCGSLLQVYGVSVRCTLNGVVDASLTGDISYRDRERGRCIWRCGWGPEQELSVLTDRQHAILLLVGRGCARHGIVGWVLRRKLQMQVKRGVEQSNLWRMTLIVMPTSLLRALLENFTG